MTEEGKHTMVAGLQDARRHLDAAMKACDAIQSPVLTPENHRKLLASWQRTGYDGYGGWLGYKRDKTDAKTQETT
jgi:hypothetical protein